MPMREKGLSSIGFVFMFELLPAAAQHHLFLFFAPCAMHAAQSMPLQNAYKQQKWQER
jgi:hypothetical protein